MKKSAKLLYIVFNCALCIVHCALLTCCSTDELCYDHPHEGDLYITFDMTEVPAHHCSTMRVWMYPADGGEGVPYDISRDGGKVPAYKGEYNILAHNSDTEWITFSGSDDYYSHSVTTRDASILEPLNGWSSRAYDDSELHPNPGERIAVPPEPIYGTGISNLTVQPGDNITITVTPLHCTYSFEFRNTGSLKNVSKISAAITGMAGSVNISTAEQSTETVTIPVGASIGADDNSIVGTFYCYGHHEEVSTPHRMALYLVMKDGKQYKYLQGDNLDVSEQVHTATDPRNVHLVIDGVKVPQNLGGTGDDNGGWDVNLGGWEDENHDINV